MKLITEGRAKVRVSTGTISAKMAVFYNPAMELNRSLTILLLNSVKFPPKRIALPMEASGLRGIRLFKELRKKPEEIHLNDISPKAVAVMRENLKLNRISSSRCPVSCQDASLFLLSSKGFDYIDIDPYGSPNPFLDAAVKRISRQGILAITATDTAPLAGTYPDACRRLYWATPLKSPFMHETGLRILIRKLQLVGAQYEKALTPIFSYYSRHYYRVFLRSEKSRQRADALIARHLWLGRCPSCLSRILAPHPTQKCSCGGSHEYAGPLYSGALWERALVAEMLRRSQGQHQEFLKTIESESRICSVGFYTLSELGSWLKLHRLPKRDTLINTIKREGFPASPTHFSPEGIAVQGSPDWKRLLNQFIAPRSFL